MNNNKLLKNQTLSALLWSFTDLIGNQGIQFIIQIILARLLLPEHFGLIGMILVFIAISNSIIDSGFTQALIREQNITQADYSTVFYFNMLISLFVYFCLYFSAPAISNFFGETELVDILRVLSFGIIINSFSIIPRAIFVKEINFKVQMKINTIAGILSGIISVVLALNGFGVWSLVIRTLTMNFVQSLLLMITKKWMPSLIFSMSSFKRLFGFGWKLLISGLIDTIYTNIYFLIIGKQYSASHLGYYTNASKLHDMASQTLTLTIQRVSYPVLSRIQDDEERMKYGFRKIIKIAAFIIFPLMIGLAAIGDILVHIIFGEKWMPMVIYFQLLCFAGMLYPIHALNLNILQVKGRSDLFLYLEIVKKGLLSILILFAVWFDTGILGLIGSAVVFSYFALFINTYFSARMISYPLKDQLKDLFPIYIISLIMGIVVFLSGEILLNNILGIILQISIGCFIYVLSCKFFKIKEQEIIIELVITLIKRFKLSKKV